MKPYFELSLVNDAKKAKMPFSFSPYEFEKDVFEGAVVKLEEDEFYIYKDGEDDIFHNDNYGSEFDCLINVGCSEETKADRVFTEVSIRQM